MCSSVRDALAAVTEQWQPHRLTSINDYEVKVVKLKGGFVWHTHDETDELFMVISGQLTIQLCDRDVVLNPNDVFVVPRGVEYCLKATEEVHALLFEPKGTVSTGAAEVVLNAVIAWSRELTKRQIPDPPSCSERLWRE